MILPFTKKITVTLLQEESVRTISSVHRVYKHLSSRSPLWFPLTVTGAPGKNKEVPEHAALGFLLPGELAH